jgi:hypothetical protein
MHQQAFAAFQLEPYPVRNKTLEENLRATTLGTPKINLQLDELIWDFSHTFTLTALSHYNTPLNSIRVQQWTNPCSM